MDSNLRKVTNTEYEKRTNKVRARIINRLMEEINNFKRIEEEGSVIEFSEMGPYSEGVTYWFYSSIGPINITCNKTNVKPTYPEGDWMLVATTTDGQIDMDNSIAVAQNVTFLGYEW